MWNRFFFIFFLISIVFISCKTKQIANKDVPKKPVTVLPSPKPVEVKPVEKPKTSREMDIALLLPIYLEQNFEIDTSASEVDLEPRSLSALSFYEGAKLAADSLAKTGVNVKLDVFDVAPDSSAKRAIIMKYQWLKNYDLVFATFPSSQAQVAADVAKLLGIKMVLTQYGNATALKNNSNLVLASPSTITQCRLMADYIVEQYHFSNFMVLSRKVKRENELADVFKNETDSLLQHHYKSSTRASVILSTDSLLKNLSSEKRNILYLPSSDESYVSSVLNALDTLEQKITVVGLPTWENFETVHFGRMLNLEIFIFSNSHLDYNDSEIKQFRRKFVSQYKNDPLYSAFQGFTLTNYFSKLFNSHDKNFMEHVADDLANAPFKFVQAQKGNGYENTSISVLKYSDYQLLKVNKTE